MPAASDESAPEKVDASAPLMGRKIIRFQDIATCGDEIWIEFQGKLYRLQSTRQGKLVLTK